MTRLKRLSPSAVPAAIERARHYRLLNEPFEAESICLDILEVDPGHRDALVTLLLACTDQFERTADAVRRAWQVHRRLDVPYDREYYAGIICERHAKAMLRGRRRGARLAAHEALRRAMAHFEKAQDLSTEAEPDALLRWNACARQLEASPAAAGAAHADEEPMLE